MGISKTSFFTDDQNSIATLAKALGHPARIAVLDYLLSVDTCICGDIVQHLPLAQPTISQHLKELKSAGIIKGTVSGNTICYCIDETALETIKQYFEKMAANIFAKKITCC